MTGEIFRLILCFKFQNFLLENETPSCLAGSSAAIEQLQGYQ